MVWLEGEVDDDEVDYDAVGIIITWLVLDGRLSWNLGGTKILVINKEWNKPNILRAIWAPGFKKSEVSHVFFRARFVFSIFYTSGIDIGQHFPGPFVGSKFWEQFAEGLPYFNPLFDQRVGIMRVFLILKKKIIEVIVYTIPCINASPVLHT